MVRAALAVLSPADGALRGNSWESLIQSTGQMGEQIYSSGLRAAAARRLAYGRASPRQEPRSARLRSETRLRAQCGRCGCRSPKIADNAYGVRSLPARTMAGIRLRRVRCTWCPRKGDAKIPSAAEPLGILQSFKILGQRQAVPAA